MIAIVGRIHPFGGEAQMRRLAYRAARCVDALEDYRLVHDLRAFRYLDRIPIRAGAGRYSLGTSLGRAIFLPNVRHVDRRRAPTASCLDRQPEIIQRQVADPVADIDLRRAGYFDVPVHLRPKQCAIETDSVPPFHAPDRIPRSSGRVRPADLLQAMDAAAWGAGTAGTLRTSAVNLSGARPLLKSRKRPPASKPVSGAPLGPVSRKRNSPGPSEAGTQYPCAPSGNVAGVRHAGWLSRNVASHDLRPGSIDQLVAARLPIPEESAGSVEFESAAHRCAMSVPPSFVTLTR